MRNASRRSRGCSAFANAKLTSALSSRNAKSLKRVLSEETKLSLYPSDSYPIHYTAGYPIYYARLVYVPRCAAADNFILAREFRRGTREYYAFSSAVPYICIDRANPTVRMESRAIRRNDITCHKFYPLKREEKEERAREKREREREERDAVTLEHRPMCQTCIGLAFISLQALICARCARLHLPALRGGRPTRIREYALFAPALYN